MKVKVKLIFEYEAVVDNVDGFDSAKEMVIKNYISLPRQSFPDHIVEVNTKKVK